MQEADKGKGTRMKSASYYARRAWDYTNVGNWAARDEMLRMARKARAIDKKRKDVDRRAEG
jgi:hypothetical protein